MLPTQPQKEIMLFDDNEELNQSALEVLENIHSKNTRRSYLSDLKNFLKYLEGKNKNPATVTANSLINYLDDLKENGKKHATIQRRLVSIRSLYKQYGEQQEREERANGNHDFTYHNPASTDRVKDWMKGLRKTIGVAQAQKRPATRRIMQTLINEIEGNRLIDFRNRAILAIGYAGASRRSELAALNIEDIERDSEGIYIIVRKGKTDQEGQGLKKFIYYGKKSSLCPVRLLEAWISKAGITEGAVFRQVNKGGMVGQRMSDTSIYTVIKKTVAAAGFDPKEFGGHSLRAGLITQLADDGAEERDIMAHSGHKSVVIMRRYIREANIKKTSPTKGIL
jgi:site-specific recombinase XerD